MKKRKFSEGGDIPSEGRFSSDTYERARAWRESQEKGSSAPAVKAAPKRRAPPVDRSNENSDSRRMPPAPAKSKMFSGMFKESKADKAEINERIKAKLASDRSTASDTARENRKGSASEGKQKVIETAGLNSKTLLPDQGYKKGGSVRGGGAAQRGCGKGKMV